MLIDKFDRFRNTLKGLSLVQNKSDALSHLVGLAKHREIDYRLKNGIRVHVPGSRLHRTTILSIQEIFGDEIYPVPESDEETVILDIGAQVGIFSIYCAIRNRRARIYSFEPDEENFESLKENLQINHMSDKIIPFKKAVSGTSGQISLMVDESSARAHSIMKNTGREVLVEAVTLESIFNDLKIQRCDILKIDIEGAEYDVFYKAPRAILDSISKIYMECHNYTGIDKSFSISGMELYLRSCGFNLIHNKGDILVAKKIA